MTGLTSNFDEQHKIINISIHTAGTICTQRHRWILCRILVGGGEKVQFRTNFLFWNWKIWTNFSFLQKNFPFVSELQAIFWSLKYFIFRGKFTFFTFFQKPLKKQDFGSFCWLFGSFCWPLPSYHKKGSFNEGQFWFFSTPTLLIEIGTFLIKNWAPKNIYSNFKRDGNILYEIAII